MIKTLSISLLLAIGLIFSGYLIGSNLQPDIYTLETIKNNINSVFVIDPTSSYKIYPEEGYYESIRLSN